MRAMNALAINNPSMAEADEIFAGATFDSVDNRPLGKGKRILTAGLLRDMVVIVSWARRGQSRSVIAMRSANEREAALYRTRLGQD
jgi:uncharacterized DUF497 family protein